MKFLKITAWKATEGQDLQISSKKSAKVRKFEQNDLYNFEGKLEKFLKIQETLIFLQKFENLKVYKQNFKQFWTICRSKIGICERCLKILKKFVIFEFFFLFAKLLRIWQVFRLFDTNLLLITCFQFQTVKYSGLVFWEKINIFEPTNENSKFCYGPNIGWIYQNAQNLRLIEKIFTGSERPKSKGFWRV